MTRGLLPRNARVSFCRYPGPQAAALATVAAVILEVEHSDSDAALQWLRTLGRTTRALLLVRDSSERFAIEALNAGAARYVTSRASEGEFHEALDAVLGDIEIGEECRECAEAARFVGNSGPMRRLRAEIGRVARCDSNVLITGETGTGKELVAELIHRNSPRREKPFVCLNSTAIPDTLIESELFGFERGAFTGAYTQSAGKLAAANRGTVFFDEIGDVSMPVQAKLLRALDGKDVHRLGGTKPVPLDIRVVSATNQDLDKAIRANRFRSDLYYRLNVVRLEVPALRERPEDIPVLVSHYVTEFNQSRSLNVAGFTEDALDSLVRHEWPGNIRELKNVIEAAFANLPAMHVDRMPLPPQFRKVRMNTAATEREKIVGALASNNWNKSKAAQELHWSRMTLYRKLDRLKITR